jgi:SAM-dependent methyltransferase
MTPSQYTFTRYLSAKKSVDDRALNQHVWEALTERMPIPPRGKPLKVLEIGAGIGTMLERMVDWGLLKFARYTAIDNQAGVIEYAHKYLSDWAHTQDFQVQETKPGLLINGEGMHIEVQLENIDLSDFLTENQGDRTWDVLIAHAFLDLLDVPSTLPELFELCKSTGIWYFSLNYDGLTVLEPTIEEEFDQLILDLYDHTMDNRLVGGVKSGDSRTGRSLFTHLTKTNASIAAAGSSDWVVHPGSNGYNYDEEYFLHFIINTIFEALRSHSDLDANRFDNWIQERHSQIERKELVYIAHQIDFMGMCSG